MAKEIKKVLMIEDDPDQIYLYKTAFDLLKLKSLTANDGEEGITLAKKEKPGVIIIDIVMEGLTGEDVLVKLKADPVTKNIPVIVFTNLDKKEVRDKFMSIGATEFWAKTELMPMALAAKIKEYLEKD